MSPGLDTCSCRNRIGVKIHTGCFTSLSVARDFFFIRCPLHQTNAVDISMIRSKHPQNPARPFETRNILSEGGWPLRAEQLLVGRFADAVGKREFQVLGDELLDVRSLDVVVLLELDNAEDLSQVSQQLLQRVPLPLLTWIDLKRARWRAAMSAYRDSTASTRDISRYSLYML